MTAVDADQDVTAISWTGGKDCNLALLYAHRDPALDVRYLLCFRPAGASFAAHPISFQRAQADSLGLELLFVDFPKDTVDYKEAYVEGIRKIKDGHGVRVIVTGDMDLVGTMERNWMEECCERAGVRCRLPLWRMDRAACLDALLAEGFDVVFTCVKSPFFDGTWIMRRLDRDALAELRAIADRGARGAGSRDGKPLDLAGERGEYHTMCVDGPLYARRVAVDARREPHREDVQGSTRWEGNIHNAETVWTISLKDG